MLVANGQVTWTGPLVRRVEHATAVFAADGGANALARIGVRPEAVIGDLDSIRAGVRRWIGEERMLVRPDQDRTDLDKALEELLDHQGLPGLTVLGALGGRLDHAMGNLGLLASRAAGERLLYLDTASRTLAVTGSTALAAVPGETWSFWTFDPAVRVSLAGVRWPVEDRPLGVLTRPSLSNEANADTVRIRVDGGAAVVLRWLGTPPVSPAR